jgi:glycosyltransferase involved in cell wall biosynthesis
MNLFVTSDKIGSETGGGSVTANELSAFKELDEVDILNPEPNPDPFQTDLFALNHYKKINKRYKLAHFYAGTYSKLIDQLKQDKTLISYTCAAHDIELSKQAHADLGIPYNYPHMTDPVLLNNYLKGYRDADLVIVPSTHSKDVVIKQGCKNVNIIPHGCNLPHEIKPISNKFVVGYLGWVCGADKGVIWLLKAWAKLKYKDALLILAGRDSTSDYTINFIREHGGGSIHLAGWLKSSSELFNKCSVYVQPSTTEAYGIEVIEALSHGRPVICSDGVGAADAISPGKTGVVVPKRDANKLAEAIDCYKSNPELVKKSGGIAKQASWHCDWSLIRDMYIKTWRAAL